MEICSSVSALLFVIIFSAASSTSAQNSSAELAVGEVTGTFIAASAHLNVWQPYVELANEYTASQITLTSPNATNIIEIGWHVHPSLYSDNDTHFFVRWTIVDLEGGGRTGCFNAECSGFVQISTTTAAGDSLFDSISNFNGTQYYNRISIAQNKYGDWWVTDEGESIGYFPASLMTDLKDGASIIAWGGKVLNKWNQDRHTYTEMGSGFFPLAGAGFSAYQQNLTCTENDNVTTHLIGEDSRALSFDSSFGCYFTYFEQETGRLYFGGSGNNPRCQS